MGWSLGHDSRFNRPYGRDIGYGCVCFCDHPDCNEVIDRGLSHVCAKEEPHGGELGCGLYFCSKHQVYHEGKTDDESGFMCEHCHEFHIRCADENNDDFQTNQFPPKPEHPAWLYHKLHDKTWLPWRKENAKQTAEMRREMKAKWPGYVPPPELT